MLTTVISNVLKTKPMINVMRQLHQS